MITLRMSVGGAIAHSFILSNYEDSNIPLGIHWVATKFAFLLTTVLATTFYSTPLLWMPPRPNLERALHSS